MCPDTNNDKQPKVVDSIFWDDAWFLSWLGIETPKIPHDQKKPVEKKEEKKESPKKTVKDESDKEREKERKPILKEARVIKQAPAEKPKKDTGVDDLIDRRRQQASYEKSTRTAGKSWPRFSKGRRTGSTHNRWPNPGGNTWGNTWGNAWGNATITLGRTNRSGGIVAQQSTSKREKVYKVSDSLKKKGIITMGEQIVVKEFSEKMGVPLQEVMKVLMANKILVAAHANIDFDTAVLIAAEFEVTVEKEGASVSIEASLDSDLQAILDQDKEATDLVSRPPIVTIMGHVDHGKTKLLDYLRKTDVVAGEAGGITQSIWASQITHNDQQITFIDTPWHELFTSLRARGSKITNIVIVVVASQEWCKPQTIEAIKHAQDAWVPIIVAITKIDLGAQKVEEIKGQIAQQGLQPEDRGGDTMVIPISAMTGQGIDDLLDAILLQYEMLELKYSPSRSAVWVVVEAHKDIKQWVTTSLLVMTGTLKVGDIVVAHDSYGKVRRMTDWTGKTVKSATGGDPVMILGIQNLPEPGRIVEVMATEKEAVKKIAAIQEHEQEFSKEAVLQSLADKIGQGDMVSLKLILKADSFGSLEAIKHAATQVDLPNNVELKIVHADVGSISDGDVTFAQAADAILVGFNVWASGSLKKKADQLKVIIKEYDIIYQFIEYLEKVGKWMLVQEEKEVRIGKLEVLGIFFKRGKDMIVWGKVIEGIAKNGAKFKIFRDDDDQVITDNEDERTPTVIGTITSLQKEQDSVAEVKEWHECGMKVRTSKKIEQGDIIEFRETQIVE